MKFFDFVRRRGRVERPVASEGIVVLNDDEVAITPQLCAWLLRCAFEDDDLIAYASDLLKTQVATTVHDLNRALYDLARKQTMIHPALTSIQGRFRAAVDAHLARVENNSTAYQPGLAGLREGGFWPNPTRTGNGRSLFEELPYANTHRFIDQSTPISSAGSCFAVEIAHQLQADGFNYVITERNRAGGTAVGPDAPVDASAAWGIIFNTPSFRQLIESSFGVRSLPKILWSGKPRPDCEEVYMDPFREHVEFATPEEYLAENEKHRNAAKEALLAAKVFIITLGLNEVWTFKMDGSVFSRSPWRISPTFVEQRVLSVQENVEELQLMLETYRAFNPDVQIIVTLSPIPLHATFLSKSAHIVEANTHSKAVLRVAAQQFVEANDGVFYFPSYELIMSGIRDPWSEDERHVKRSSVARVMEMFKEMYVMQ